MANDEFRVANFCFILELNEMATLFSASSHFYLRRPLSFQLVEIKQPKGGTPTTATLFAPRRFIPFKINNQKEITDTNLYIEIEN